MLRQPCNDLQAPSTKGWLAVWGRSRVAVRGMVDRARRAAWAWVCQRVGAPPRAPCCCTPKPLHCTIADQAPPACQKHTLWLPSCGRPRAAPAHLWHPRVSGGANWRGQPGLGWPPREADRHQRRALGLRRSPAHHSLPHLCPGRWQAQPPWGRPRRADRATCSVALPSRPPDDLGVPQEHGGRIGRRPMPPLHRPPAPASPRSQPPRVCNAAPSLTLLPHSSCTPAEIIDSIKEATGASEDDISASEECGAGARLPDCCGHFGSGEAMGLSPWKFAGSLDATIQLA